MRRLAAAAGYWGAAPVGRSSGLVPPGPPYSPQYRTPTPTCPAACRPLRVQARALLGVATPANAQTLDYWTQMIATGLLAYAVWIGATGKKIF